MKNDINLTLTLTEMNILLNGLDKLRDDLEGEEDVRVASMYTQVRDLQHRVIKLFESQSRSSKTTE